MVVKTRIQNVVLWVTFGDTTFDLDRVLRSLEGTVYKPKRFPGVVYKSVHPSASFSIFSSGKMICAGARSMEEANRAIRKLTRKLGEAHIKVKGRPKVRVQNIVASIDFGGRIDIERIAGRFENTEYEPEVFPGLVFRLEDPKVVLLLFVSGKGICVGAKSMKDVERAAQEMGKILRRR